MKPKRLLALLMAVVTVVSVFTISASAANTEDTYYTYSWKSNSRYDYTPTRKKMNATPVYLKTQEYTLPYNGYYAKTLYGTSSQSANLSASASEYWINNYTAYVIRANGTSVSQIGKYVRIRGHYSDTTYCLESRYNQCFQLHLSQLNSQMLLCAEKHTATCYLYVT